MRGHDRDYKDALGGLILIGAGAFTALYAGSLYKLGTVRQMGPGMVPTILGGILAGLGLLILLPALFRPVVVGESVEWRPMIMVGLAVAAFALTVERLGLLPAVVLMTLFASMAGRGFALVKALVLGIVLAAFAIVIFIYGLGIPIRIVRWSW
jgi:hypothetical protein